MRDPSLAAAMGARARDYVVKDFSIRAEAEKYVAVYRPLLGGAPTIATSARD